MENDIQYSLLVDGQVEESVLALFPTLPRLLDQNDAQDCALLLAEKNAYPLAVGVLTYPKRHTGKMTGSARLILLEVAPSVRMQGVAKGLLNAIEAYAATVAEALYVDGGAIVGRKPMQSLLSQSGYLSPSAQPDEKTSQWKKVLI